jgi:hypothetical protein
MNLQVDWVLKQINFILFKGGKKKPLKQPKKDKGEVTEVG